MKVKNEISFTSTSGVVSVRNVKRFFFKYHYVVSEENNDYLNSFINIWKLTPILLIIKYLELINSGIAFSKYGFSKIEI